MRVTWQSIAEILVDPVERTALRYDGHIDALVSESGRYPLIGGQPNLLPNTGLLADGWQFPKIEIVAPSRPKPHRQPRSLAKRIRRRMRDGAGARSQHEMFLELVRSGAAPGARPRVLIVGGASVGEGSEALVGAPDIDVVAFDIYPTAETTFVADGHSVPIADASIDAVWVQAVLEHVYRPGCVVAEIARVLRPHGLLYAETPFLQPVHEGAFDYVRFSESGHRLLFPMFEEIASGPLGGPGAMLSLAVRGLVGGLTHSQRCARLAYAASLPLTLLDRFVASEWRTDFAAGCFFLGRLAGPLPREFSPEQTYRGVQRG